MNRLLVLLLGGLAGAYAAKERCGKCSAKFRLLGECPVCERHVCSSCGSKVRPIRSHKIDISYFEGTCCSDHYAEWNEEMELCRKAAMNASYVEVYPKNYRGRVPEPQVGVVIETEAPVKDRDAAELRLKYLAALEGAEHITEFECIRHTAQDGNYKYATWTAVGVI